MLNCPKAWEITKGKGAVVVVSDQGFHLGHPELVGRIAASAEFGLASLKDSSQSFHGTEMSRIALAVAPEARIIPILCSASAGLFEKQRVGSLAENIAKSFELAAEKRVDVVSASWMSSLAQHVDLLAAIRQAVDRGVTVSWFHYPRSDPGVLRPSFVYVPTPEEKDSIGFADRFLTDPPGFHPVEIEAGLSGTAPQAAGLVALVRSVNPALAPHEVQALIFENSTPIGDGILVPDAFKIVVAAAEKRPVPVP